MIFRAKNGLITFILITVLCMGSITSFAQKNDDVKSLGDILNDPVEDFGSGGKPLTSAIMANHYYKTCTSKESIVLNKDEKEILCGCNAAKMSETLTVEDFKNLDKRTAKGKDARGRMLAFSYAPCMEYAIRSKVHRDCYKSDHVKDIVSGKNIICKCATDRFAQYVIENASFIIMQSTHYSPMTIDPLGYYFENLGYHGQRDHIIKQCRFEMDYSKNNK